MVEWGSAQGNAHLHDDEGGIEPQKDDALPTAKLALDEAGDSQDGHDNQYQRDLHKERGGDAGDLAAFGNRTGDGGVSCIHRYP